jgi:hypothetical protein
MFLPSAVIAPFIKVPAGASIVLNLSSEVDQLVRSPRPGYKKQQWQQSTKLGHGAATTATSKRGQGGMERHGQCQWQWPTGIVSSSNSNSNGNGNGDRWHGNHGHHFQTEELNFDQSFRFSSIEI